MEEALPGGLRAAEVPNACAEVGSARLAEAAAVLGEAASLAEAERLGRYELADEVARELRLRGVALGEGGEVPALSPARWRAWPAAPDLRELVGLRLTAEQKASFLRFLTRNHEGDPLALAPERALELARPFFLAEPLAVVLRDTEPRFPRS
jgi:hypothetical protein